MHARVIFCRVGGLLVVYILTKGKKSINVEKNENVELPHTQVVSAPKARVYPLF